LRAAEIKVQYVRKGSRHSQLTEFVQKPFDALSSDADEVFIFWGQCHAFAQHLRVIERTMDQNLKEKKFFLTAVKMHNKISR